MFKCMYFFSLARIFIDFVSFSRLQISVTEMIMNKHIVVTLPPTNETVMKHIFYSIKYGGTYNITIATDVENAISTQPFIYIAPPIKPPHQLTVLHDNMEYLIYWKEPDLPENIKKDTDRYFEILVAEGSRTINESTAKVLVVKDPPYRYKDAKTDTIYTFAARLVTNEGYQSPLSETWSTQISGKLSLTFLFKLALIIFSLFLFHRIAAPSDNEYIGHFIPRYTDLFGRYSARCCARVFHRST